MYLLLAVMFLLFLFTRRRPTDVREVLLQHLRKQVGKKVRNAVLLVDAPAIDLKGAWVGGDAREGVAMTASTPFISASIGKLFVAATVVSLAKKGVLSLDDSASKWLSADTLEGLPLHGGVDAFDAVRLSDLLGHTSGLPDYYAGQTSDGSPNVFELVAREPERSWSREELLAFTREHFAPAPNDDFLYSDLNYDLIGLAIESATGRPFHEVVRAEVIEPLGLRNTWYYNFEEAPEGAQEVADVWFDDMQLVGKPALTMDGAGGGLATTAEDLRVFMRSLANGETVGFDDLSDFTEDALEKGIDYGLGLWRIRPGRLSFFLRGRPTMLGVSGSTGSYVYYVPDADTVVAGTFNQTKWQEKHLLFLLMKVLPALQRVQSS